MKILRHAVKNHYISIITISFAILLLLFYYFLTLDVRDILGDKVVEIYYADNISPAHQIIIDNFNDINKNRIKVIPIDLPFRKFSTNERKELFARSLRSKSRKLDVFAVDLVWVHRFAKWSEPLDAYLSAEEINQFQNYALESCYYKNTLAAFPMFIDISLMYYRDDLLKQLPNYNEITDELYESMTWEDFISLSKNFDTDKNPFYTFQADDYEGLICSYYELILNKDSSFFSNQIKFTNPVSENSMQLLVDLVNKYKITDKSATQFREKSSYRYFLDNDGIFVRGWQSMLKDTKNLQHDPEKEKYVKIAPLPHLKDNDPGFILGGWNLMLSKHSLHKSETMEFIKFMTNKESQELLFQMGSYLPTRKDLYIDTTFIEEHPDIVDIGKLLEYGIHRPFLENYTRNSDIVSHFVKLAIDNKISVAEAVKRIDENLANHEIIMK